MTQSSHCSEGLRNLLQSVSDSVDSVSELLHAVISAKHYLPGESTTIEHDLEHEEILVKLFKLL